MLRGAERSCRVLCCVFAVLLASNAAAESIAIAPISSSELDRYAEQLGLSRAQHQSLAAAHQDSLREFRERFDPQVERYLALRREVGEVPFNVAPRETFSAFVTLHRTLAASVRAIDEKLLRSIEATLTAEQQAELGRVIDARRRAVIVEGPFVRDWLRRDVLEAGEVADLPSLIDELALPAEVRSAIDDTLRRAEGELTRLLIELERKSITIWEAWRRDVDARGYHPDLEIDARFAIMAPAWEAAASEGVSTMRRLRVATRRAADEIIRTLPEPHAGGFHTQFYSRSYRLAMSFGDELRRRMDAARELELNDEKAAELAALADSFAAHDRRIVARLANRIDEAVAGAVPRISGDGSALKADLERMAEDRRSVDERMLAALAEMLGPVRFERTAPASVMPGAGDLAARLSEKHRDSLDPDLHVPGPISRETMRRFAEALDLCESQRDALESLHKDYRRAFLAVRQGPIEEMITIYTGFAPLDDGSGMHGWTPAENDHRKYELRTQALDRIRELDEHLFRDVAIAVQREESANETWRLRLARAHDYLRPHPIRDRSRTAYTEHRVDLLALLGQAELADDELAVAASVLRERSDELIRLSETLHRASVEASYRYGLSVARDRDQQESASLAARWREQEEARMHGRLALAAVCREVRDELIEHLPHAGDRLKRAYDRLAHPNLLIDESSLHAALDAAFSLERLTAEKRAALVEIKLAYRGEYERVTARMVELVSGSPYAGLARGLSQAAREDAAVRRERIDHLLQERANLAGEALVQLRQTLTAEQLAAIGLK